jgi:hypothetical protein
VTRKRLWIATLVVAQVCVIATAAHAGSVPVPEPMTLTLLGVGAAAVGGATWWSRRKKK